MGRKRRRPAFIHTDEDGPLFFEQGDGPPLPEGINDPIKERADRPFDVGGIGVLHPTSTIETAGDWPMFAADLDDEQQEIYKASFNEALAATDDQAIPYEQQLERASNAAWRLLGIEPLELLDAFRKMEFIDDELVEDEPNYDDMEEIDPSLIDMDEVERVEREEGPDPDETSIIATEQDDADYGWGLSKVGDEMRYTFAVVCKASGKDRAIDSHNEFPSADELRKAQWGYLRSGDRNIYLPQQLTSRGMRKAGEWVGLISWPNAVETELLVPVTEGGFSQMQKRSAVIPAESVWMGVVWEEWAWDLVKSGAVRGFSLEGPGQRRPIGG